MSVPNQFRSNPKETKPLGGSEVFEIKKEKGQRIFWKGKEEQSS